MNFDIIKKPLLLLVDDVPENLKIVGNIFKEANLQIAIASDGEFAIEAAKAQKPDLILLDIMMPGIDGFEVCKRLKDNQETKDIPILFLTAKNNIEDILKGYEYGAVDYVTKPFNPQELLARVQTHLELKFSREQSLKLNEKLKSIILSRDKLLSIIAHDLRAPFNTLIGFSNILSDEVDTLTDEEIKHFINIIKETSNNTYKLLDNLLSWTRLQQGKITIEKTLFNLNEIVQNVCNLLSSTALAKNVNITNEVDPSICMVADENILTTVIRNLISNSIKFTSSDDHIYINAKKEEDSILISIKDTGVGISENVKEKIFTIDGNTSTIGTASEQGSGLGLVLCKELVDLHNGKIWFASVEHIGTTFFIEIPQ